MLHFLQLFPADSTVLDNICNYTNLTALHTDFGFWDGLAIGIAFAGFIVALYTFKYTKRTYRSQEATQYNTRKLDQEAQKFLLLDLVRHLYRNMVVTLTMETKMKAENFKVYPSEEHLVKLKIPMENIHLEVFYGEEDKYTKMHDLYLKLRNYNTEIDIICRHFMDRTIDEETKQRDLNTLKFKCGFLTRCISETFGCIWGNDMRNELIEQIRLSHDKNVKDNNNGHNPIDPKILEAIVPYQNGADIYVTAIFDDRSEEFFRWLNEDVRIECGKKENKNQEDQDNQEVEKIYMIKFEKEKK